MTRYQTIASCNARYAHGRWSLAPEAAKAAKNLGMRGDDYLRMHTNMAFADEIWMFHKKIAKGEYELVVAPK